MLMIGIKKQIDFLEFIKATALNFIAFLFC